MFLRGYPKVGKVPTQQKGPTERGPKGLENFLVSGTIIVTLVTGTIPSVCTTECGHAVPSHASPKAGHPEKPVRDPEKEKREKTNTTGWREGKNMGLRDVIVLENNYETREPLHERRRWVEVDSDWPYSRSWSWMVESASWRISHESYSLQQRPKSFQANKNNISFGKKTYSIRLAGRRGHQSKKSALLYTYRACRAGSVNILTNPLHEMHTIHAGGLFSAWRIHWQLRGDRCSGDQSSIRQRASRDKWLHIVSTSITIRTVRIKVRWPNGRLRIQSFLLLYFILLLFCFFWPFGFYDLCSLMFLRLETK